MTTPRAAIGHSHAESWMMRPELQQVDVEFAQLVRPIVQELKIRLIGLGALALHPRLSAGRSVEDDAGDLADRIGEWIDQTTTSRQTDSSKLLLAGLLEIREWAQVAASNGVSGAVAAGLSGGYRRTREVTDLVWHSELVPEGRTPSEEKELGDG